MSRAGHRFPATPALVLRQVRYQQLSFRRTPIAVFFTLALPLIMLVLFNALFGDEEVETEGGTWPLNQFYTGSLAAFSAVSATFTNLANLIPIRREEGVLKRWRGTPLPPWAYIAGAVGCSVVVAAVGVVIMLTVGVVAYDLDIEAAKVPAAVVTFIVGVGAFAALGVAVASLVPNPEAAPAVANAIILPLAFVSDVFIQIDDPPAWVDFVGDLFPLKAFVQSFQAAFNPNVPAPGFEWGKLAFVAAWGVVGLLVALRWFKWEPSTRRRPRRRGEPAPAV
jgi:ABC-2 type transport system permease protein